jgi:hypothetical protein
MLSECGLRELRSFLQVNATKREKCGFGAGEKRRKTEENTLNQNSNGQVPIDFRQIDQVDGFPQPVHEMPPPQDLLASRDRHSARRIAVHHPLTDRPAAEKMRGTRKPQG